MSGVSKIDLTGQVFGRLTAIALGPPNTFGQRQWRVRCECGGQSLVSQARLRDGRTQSCGCLRLERAAAANTKHGANTTIEYSSWMHAKARCFDSKNRSFHRYGGRGITMCAEWRDDFAAFLAYLGPCPLGRTLDRVKTNGHYEPGNVRWATRSEQNNNTRRNRFVFVNDRRMTLAQAAREVGICDEVLRTRLGVSVQGRRLGHGPTCRVGDVVIALETAQ